MLKDGEFMLDRSKELLIHHGRNTYALSICSAAPYFQEKGRKHTMNYKVTDHCIQKTNESKQAKNKLLLKRWG